MPTATGIRIINYVQQARDPITYVELGDHLGMRPHWLGAPLRPIRRNCREHGLPRFDALVIRNDGLPGSEFNEDGVRLTREQHDRYLAEIQKYGLDRLCEALLAI